MAHEIMSTPTFLATNIPEIENPISYPRHTSNSSFIMDDYYHYPDFEVSDYLVDQPEQDFTSGFPACHLQPSICQKINSTESSANSIHGMPRIIKCKKGLKRDPGYRIGFRIKTELEIMDDGYKWRKYGKKMVKDSPNPRNYYRCSSGGCNVKKRVERDREDSSYVITTYEGVHNHETPCVVYYDDDVLSPTIPSGWTSQACQSNNITKANYSNQFLLTKNC